MAALKPFLYERPQTLEELSTLLTRHAGMVPRYLAGGTDLLVAMRTGKDTPELVVDLKGLPELRGINCSEPQKLWIGALVTIHSLEINETNCVQQVHGGVIMGLGIALSEELKFDDEGRMLNNNLHDYKIQTCMDVPPIEAIIVEVPHPLGPYGAKGLGEAPVGPMAPAVAHAVANAAGLWIKKLPITPERILETLRKGNK